MPELKTVWGENLNPEAILPEYPRPQLARNSYVNLNGRWDYAITASDAEPEHWDGEILVPFSPEAPLSGVNRTLLPGQTLWYRREIQETRREGQRLLLHFGAVDQEAKIYIVFKRISPICPNCYIIDIGSVSSLIIKIFIPFI